MHDSSIQNVFNRTLHDLICDPIGIVVILIIIKVRYVRYAWILGVFVLSCCLILLHTYLHTYGRTDFVFFLLLWTGWIGRRKEEKRKMAEDSTSTRRASTGVCWYTFLLIISGEGEWRFKKNNPN